jgi:apolipoprotein N-acyltransferase
VYFLGYAGWGLWPLALLWPVPLLWGLQRLNNAPGALRLGLGFGTVAHLGGYDFLYGTLRQFSGFGPLPCLLLYAGICVVQGGQLALFTWLSFWLRSRGRDPVVLAALCYGAVERIYPLLFPSYLAAALYQQPIALQVVELGGPTLLSMAMVASGAAVYAALRAATGGPQRRRFVLGVAVAAMGVVAYGGVRMARVQARAQQAETLRVGVVQANMGLIEKRTDWREGRRRHMEMSRDLERRVRPDLLVWPETAIATPIAQGVKDVSPLLGSLATPVLFGALTHGSEGARGHLYNSAVLADVDGKVLGRVDKQHLLAFAEYMPLGEQLPALYALSPHSGALTAGEHNRPLPLGPYRLTALICYEDILPGFVRDAVRRGEPHLLVNLTNDAWFGRSGEPEIHLALATLRAVEHRRYLVRATNSGISAVIDPLGRVVVRTGLFERATLDAEVAMLQGLTPFARLGDWPGWGALVLTLLLGLRGRSPAVANAGRQK